MEPDIYEPDYGEMRKYITGDGRIMMRHADQPPDADWTRVPIGMDIKVEHRGDRNIFYFDMEGMSLREQEQLLEAIKERFRQKRSEEAGIGLTMDAKDCEPQCGEGDCPGLDMPPEGGMRYVADRPPVKMDILYDYIHASEEESERILARYKRWRLEMLKIDIMAQNPQLLIADENAWKDS